MIMTAEILRNLLWALLGAAIAEGLDAYHRLSDGRRVYPARAVAFAIAGTIFAVFYFRVVAGNYGPIAPFQYALFVVLVFETIAGYYDAKREPRVEVAGYRAAFAVVVLPGLVISGGVAVWAAGSFGALIAEALRLRRKRASLTGDLAWSLLVVAVSGGTAVLHGIDHVNALTAAQLGAAGPLVASRVRL
jgi:hypothetical protein